MADNETLPLRYFYRCRDCGRTDTMPRAMCPHCLTDTVGCYVVRDESTQQELML